jgi:uncharacterized protein (DUF433 family)
MKLFLSCEPIPLRTDDDGAVRVGNTRITLDIVVYAYRDGATPEDIVKQYPSLQLGEVYSAIGYYLRRKTEVEIYLCEREREAAKTRQDGESRRAPVGVADRLLAQT